MNAPPQQRLVAILYAAPLLLLVALVNSLGGCRQPPATTGESIGMVTFAGYAPLYLAKEKGYFGDLKVELRRIEDVPSIRAAVAKGDLEAYLATPDIALDTNQKPPGVAVWAIDESSGGDGVVVSEGINELADLKGKLVAAEPGLPPNFILMYLLHKNGMSVSDLQFKDMTTQDAATAFSSKSVDAAGIYEPYLSTVAKQRAGSKVVISSSETPGLIVDLIFVDEKKAVSRKEDVKRVIEGWRKAVKFIAEHPDEANEIMAKSFNLPVAEFKDIAAGVKWLDVDDNHRLFGTAKEPGPLYSNFAVVRDVLKRNRPSVYDAQAEDHLTRDFVEQAK
jgi:NitT/TauT family transport system substrate-binding protein